MVSRPTLLAYFGIAAALVLLLILTIWSAVRDANFLRGMLLKTEIDALRANAIRTVGGIERDLQVGGFDDLRALQPENWLHRQWQRLARSEERRQYAAIVSEGGEVLMHSDPAQVGKRLSRDWYDRVLFDVGSDVFQTRSPALGWGQLAYDVSVPIEVDARDFGEYHVGLNAGWFAEQTASIQRQFLWRRFLLIAGVLLIVLLATTSLYHLARRTASLGQAVHAATLQRATEVGKLAAGLAHEIRNPLHAIKLNLHVFRKVHEREAELPDEEITQMLEQSTREISRVEQLMHELVGFATPDGPPDDVIDLNEELRNLVEFLQQEMLDHQIELCLRLPNQRLGARMDRGRLRQIMLNLLQNARQAMPDGGWINISLRATRGWIAITVSDNGPGIPEGQCQQIFEPFHSSKPEGTGLGLALVKRFVEEVDGRIDCENNTEGGSTFRIQLRQATLT